MIRVTTRCRVDLAGGTLDIWPIGLFHPGSSTVNVAVDVTVSVTIRRSDHDYVVRQTGAEVRADSAAGLRAHPESALVGSVAEHLALPPFELEISSASPRGAGLGASSALTVAVLAAGECLLYGRTIESPERRAALARDLEARLMGLPTGIQDHLPAQLGGAIVIEHRPGGEVVRQLAVDLGQLGEHLLVAYTGQSHFSAGNNWQILRRRFEAEPDVVSRLDRIRDVAAQLPSALEAAEWRRVGELVGEEWQARRGLAPEVDSERIAQLLALAGAGGAWGGKACGAGGGGCVVALAPPARRAGILAAWLETGAQPLAAVPTAGGLEIEGTGA